MGIVERLRNNTHLGQPDWVEALLEDVEIAVDLIERLKGYAKHPQWCRAVEIDAPNCSCGLTALIKEIDGE